MPFLTTWKAKDVEKASFGHFCRVEKCGKKDVDFDRNAKASKRWDFHGDRSKFLVLGCVYFEENGNKRIVRWSKNDSYETPKSPFSRGFGLPFCEKKEVFGLSFGKITSLNCQKMAYDFFFFAKEGAWINQAWGEKKFAFLGFLVLFPPCFQA